MVYHQENHLPVGVRIWFHPNCRIRVFGEKAKKMVKIVWEASIMTNNNILNIFFRFSAFFLFSFFFLFWPNFKDTALKTRSRKYWKEKVEKTKINVKNVIIYHMWYVRTHKRIQLFLGHFWPFLPYFTSWQFGFISKNLNSAIWVKPDSDFY